MSLAYSRAAQLRITLTYLWRHRRLPNLASPKLFTELVQARKLFERDGRIPLLADKVTAKSVAAERLGRGWIIPMLWSGSALPATFPWGRPVVVKARHGCNQNAFVNGEKDWQNAQRKSQRWMRSDYGRWLDEWSYAEIPRGLLIEPRIGPLNKLPLDYKIFVFGGEATHVQVHIDRASRHRWVLHDRDWNALLPGAPVIGKPTALGAMLSAAEEMASGFDFARVDFYQPERQPLFGEITFYPGSGLYPIHPANLNAEWGKLWLEALRRRKDQARHDVAFAA